MKMIDGKKKIEKINIEGKKYKRKKGKKRKKKKEEKKG